MNMNQEVTKQEQTQAVTLQPVSFWSAFLFWLTSWSDFNHAPGTS